jgi:hypothetical protein
VLIFLIALPGGAAVDFEAQATATPDHSDRRFVIKFASEGGRALHECAHCLLAETRGFRSALGDGSGSLDRLNARHGVRAARGLFVERHGRSTKEARRTLDQRSQRVRAARTRKPDAELPDLSNVYVFQLDEPADIDRVCREFAADPHVDFCQPDYVMTIQERPDDPSFDELWGLRAIQAEPAWELGRGEGIVVGVVDTGVDYLHEDMADNVWTNAAEAAGLAGVDDDGNGYVDDVHGWNFVSGTNETLDDHRHGTHVSGTIAATGDNGVGVIGVAPAAKILPVKALDSHGIGFSSDLADGLVYAALNGADVVNNSWGSNSPNYADPITESAVRAAHAMGVVVVFAAGNSTSDTRYFSPQHLRETITVAAIEAGDTPAVFTNWGLPIDVAAPGVDVLSLYGLLSGTSMAAPHVAGLAALLLSRRPDLDNEEVRLALRGGSDDLEPPGFDLDAGQGRINALRTLQIESVLSVEIDEARLERSVAGDDDTLSVTGSAQGSGFEQYSLFFAPDDRQPSWQPAQGPVPEPREDGPLGQIELGRLEPRSYYVRLSARSTEGLDFEDVVRVSLNAPRRLSSTVFSQTPDIDGDFVVWDGFPSLGQSREVFLYDLGADVEWQLTDDADEDSNARVSGNVVVWRSLLADGHKAIRVCELDPATGDCPVILVAEGTGAKQEPAVDGRRLVWVDRPVSPGALDLYFCEIEDGACPSRPLVLDINWLARPDIEGDFVVWDDFQDGSVPRDIFLYDLSDGTQHVIAANPSLEYRYPRLADGLLAWDVYDNDELHGVRYCDLDPTTLACPEKALATGPDGQDPAVSARRIVWEDIEEPSGVEGIVNWDVFVHDLATETTQRITINDRAQTKPAISGTRIVFQDYREGDSPDISLIELDAKAEQTHGSGKP